MTAIRSPAAYAPTVPLARVGPTNQASSAGSGIPVTDSPAGPCAVWTTTANGLAAVGSRPSRAPVSSRGTICPRTLNSP